jgi:hypothetical protein
MVVRRRVSSLVLSRVSSFDEWDMDGPCMSPFGINQNNLQSSISRWDQLGKVAGVKVISCNVSLRCTKSLKFCLQDLVGRKIQQHHHILIFFPTTTKVVMPQGGVKIAMLTGRSSGTFIMLNA